MGGLFGKDLAPMCAYCETGRPVSGGEEVLCPLRGVMRAGSHCRKFRYDPLKRQPRRPKLDRDFSRSDFEL